ncbi:hypothetical protein NE865_04976 [Phthorimaea operculella]|nr:hypothetical protein NE865_04976 [Phthorimaea operculella]
MSRLSDNYFHRKCYSEREQVPTQSAMKKIMGELMASVYFKSMNYKLKILAGLEPPLKGGGVDWYQPPTEQLAGRAVLKPCDIKQLKMMGFDGLNKFGEIAKEKHYRDLKEETRLALLENDRLWKERVTMSNRYQYDTRSRAEAEANSMKLREALEEFEVMYRNSVTKIEELVMTAARKEIERSRQEAYEHMNQRYKDFLHIQATRMYNEYEANLDEEKARQRAEFKKDAEDIRTEMGNKLHDINYEKHLAIEKIRHFLQCQNLACQVYVALKEKEECTKEMEEQKHEHKKKMRSMRDDIQVKDLEISLEKEQQQKRQEFNRIWKRKICHIVKKFQTFVEYCLKLLPEHAEFFLNMEKLMMLQLSQVIENPSVASIIESEPVIKTPVPQPHPFYLVCGKGYKPHIDPKLCPEHCTSSASQFPVIVINKRCIYAACDNMEMFRDKISRYIGTRGPEEDLEDEQNYDICVPVKYTSATQLHELQLESSLMQVLQQELPNVRDLPVACGMCKIPYCFCSPFKSVKDLKCSSFTTTRKPSIRLPKEPLTPEQKLSKSDILELQREPKWESYMNYVESKKCKCAKMAKKHLREHLPPYMRNMSPYAAPELPNYETCPIEKLQAMVKKARGIHTPPPPPERTRSRTRDIGTQYSDQELEFLCTCFSETDLTKFLKQMQESVGASFRCDVVDGALSSSSFLGKTVSTFVTDRAMSVRRLLDNNAELEQIFKNSKCDLIEK